MAVTLKGDDQPFHRDRSFGVNTDRGTWVNVQEVTQRIEFKMFKIISTAQKSRLLSGDAAGALGA
jgi:hypothetical protein